MKRATVSIVLILSTLFIYSGWFDVELPETAEDLNNDIDQHALVYEIIDGTPLIVAAFGDATFLDTLQIQRISKAFPPFPQWQWTGNWERVNDPGSAATSELSSEFGPTVLFGVLNDDSIMEVQVLREGEVVLSASVHGEAYILPAEGVKLTDTVRFLNADGDMVATETLMEVVSPSRMVQYDAGNHRFTASNTHHHGVLHCRTFQMVHN